MTSPFIKPTLNPPDLRFMAYWLISGLAFACHFSFIVISPIIFMERLSFSPYEFAWALLLYGAAYVFGGIVASALHRHLPSRTQIIVGLGLIALIEQRNPTLKMS